MILDRFTHVPAYELTVDGGIVTVVQRGGVWHAGSDWHDDIEFTGSTAYDALKALHARMSPRDPFSPVLGRLLREAQ